MVIFIRWCNDFFVHEVFAQTRLLALMQLGLVQLDADPPCIVQMQKMLAGKKDVLSLAQVVHQEALSLS